MSTPYKDPKTGIFKLRKRFPKELQEFFEGKKKEYWKSLETKNLHQAKARFSEALAEYERLAGVARAKLDRRTDQLTNRQAKAMAGDWLAARLKFTEDLPEFDQVAIALDVHGDMLRAGKFEAWVPDTKEILDHHSLNIPDDSEHFQRLLEAVAKADYQYYMMLERRHGGDWRDAELVTYPELDKRNLSVAHKDEASIKLSELLELYKKEDMPDKRRTMELDSNVKRFTKLHGDLPVVLIDKSHFVELKDKMTSAGLNYRTVNGRLSKLRVILRHAVNNGYLENNVADGVAALKPKQDNSRMRLAYEADQLKKLFDGPVHSKGARPLKGRGEASFWVPIIALYSGCRLSEIAQLDVEDFKEDEGFWYFDVHRMGNNKTKNTGSVRRIPLHKQLLRLGLIEYIRLQGAGRIFPTIQWSKSVKDKKELDELESGQIASNWGEWFNSYLDDLGLKPDKESKTMLDFHSFRHTFIDAAREAAVDPELRMKITGHTPQEVGAMYGTKKLIRRLKEEIDKIEYDLPKIFNKD